MNSANSQVLPAPPNLIHALLAGFETITNHLGLIAFSILVDGLLWFGPQVRLTKIFGAYSAWVMGEARLQTPELVASLDENLRLIQPILDQVNLVSALRTVPVGVASLLASGTPPENPLGAPLTWQPPGFLTAAGLWLLLALVGMTAGALYFSVVSQASLKGKVAWKPTLRRWPWLSGQVFLLAVFWLAALAVATLPLSCILPFMFAVGSNLGRLFVFIYGGIVIWLLFPLVLSPLGIFAYDEPMWRSVLRGARVVRWTFPITLLFVLAVLVLSQGLDLVWRMPDASSWLAVIGVVGHAFVATSLLAAAFIYYSDANRYVQQRMDQLKA